MSFGLLIAAVSLAIWLYLLIARGGFWRADIRDDMHCAEPQSWPPVVVVIPARNEADVIVQSLSSLQSQDYGGTLSIILVDDQSHDRTAVIAQQSAACAKTSHGFTLLPGQPVPAGWTGKVWAMKQGIDLAERSLKPPIYLWLTDADIAYAPDTLRRLVARAQAGNLVLTSLMAKLRCESLAERGLIPAFIFFFQMLYPFSWVNQATHPLAAAAGGCMLVKAEALRKAGGIDAIRGSLVDDCALAKILKSAGPIWLGLTERAHSLRAYPRLHDIRHMVARSAYDQLRYSPLLLIGTIVGMTLTYLVPPALALISAGAAQACGITAWLLMAFAFQPILKFYRVSPWWGLALPGIASAYLVFTLDSAYQHMRGKGGLWKGRVQAKVSGMQ